jgi:hypothetical protein
MEPESLLYEAIMAHEGKEVGPEVLEMAMDESIDIHYRPTILAWTCFEIAVLGNHAKLVDAMLSRHDAPENIDLDDIFIFQPNDERHLSVIRVLMNYPGHKNYIRIFGLAAQASKVEIAEMILATGELEDIAIEYEQDEMTGEKTRYIVEIANNCLGNPRLTAELRKKHGIFHDKMYKLYVMILLLSQGYLDVMRDHLNTPMGRFFHITSSLPMELQMRLCHLYYRDPGAFLVTKQIKHVLWFMINK